MSSLKRKLVDLEEGDLKGRLPIDRGEVKVTGGTVLNVVLQLTLLVFLVQEILLRFLEVLGLIKRK
jgi:hypothetical protein